MAIEPPCSVVCVFSNGECRYARANRTHPNDLHGTHHVSEESPLRNETPYPDVDFLVESRSCFNIEQLGSTIRHRAVFGGDVLL